MPRTPPKTTTAQAARSRTRPRRWLQIDLVAAPFLARLIRTHPAAAQCLLRLLLMAGLRNTIAITTEQLAAAAGLASQTVTQALATLQNAGFLRRVPQLGRSALALNAAVFWTDQRQFIPQALFLDPDPFLVTCINTAADPDHPTPDLQPPPRHTSRRWAQLDLGALHHLAQLIRTSASAAQTFFALLHRTGARNTLSVTVAQLAEATGLAPDTAAQAITTLIRLRFIARVPELGRSGIAINAAAAWLDRRDLQHLALFRDALAFPPFGRPLRVIHVPTAVDDPNLIQDTANAGFRTPAARRTRKLRASDRPDTPDFTQDAA